MTTTETVQYTEATQPLEIGGALDFMGIRVMPVTGPLVDEACEHIRLGARAGEDRKTIFQDANLTELAKQIADLKLTATDLIISESGAMASETTFTEAATRAVTPFNLGFQTFVVPVGRY